MADPLLTEPRRPQHVKPRLLGHWGTSPGLNLVHTHLDRVIKARELDALCVWGPGHGGPAVLANAWLEGSYTETYPDITRDAPGLGRLFRQFSFPGGVPSHVAPKAPGSIHERKEGRPALAVRPGTEKDLRQEPRPRPEHGRRHTAHDEELPMADSELPGTDGPIRVFLLDDHEVVRRGVHDLLDDERDITVVGEAGTVEQALVRVPALRPQVAVLDVRLPDGDGVSVCRELRSRMPELACLMLTSFDDEEALLDSIMAGASGYVLKQIRGSDLVSAVRTVAAGQSLLDPSATAKVMARLRGERTGEPEPDALPGLTEREREILALIGEGLTNRQIGRRLYLAEKTVKNHISRLLAKLGVERRIQAAVIATQAQDRLKNEGH
ncbi:DNA-binding NarL/FixJ family response regulator [Streptomyces sp. LBL]|nr:DNA-binding NarL/FixJ family response regulator [Streptomyces sp. LBL]